MTDPAADPFGERARATHRWRCRLLGADFVFETDDRRAQRFVREAFEGLPRYRLGGVRTLHFRVVLRQRRRPRARAAPPPPRFAADAGVVVATVDADNYAVLVPRQQCALLVVSSDMLRPPYYLRYELLEFAVITLAVRALGLVPLHAGCLALGGRGVLLVGPSGSGKSTLALHGAAAGLGLVSEDNLFVNPRNLRAASLPNYLYLRTGLPRRLLPAGLDRPLARSVLIRRRSGVRKRALDLRQTRLALARRAPRIVAVILLTSKAGDSGRLLVRQSAGRAIERLRNIQAYAAGRPEWPMFARAMRRLPCFELRRGTHPAEAVANLKSLLRHVR